MENVILVKTIGGEYFIGFNKANIDPNSKDITISDPRVLSMQMTQRGPALACVDVVPFCKEGQGPKNLTFTPDQIICTVDETNIKDELVNGYKTEITGIQTVSKPGIII